MKNYEVTMKAVTTKTFYVEAPSKEEAETVALIMNLPKESQDDLKAFLPVEYRSHAHYKEHLTLDVEVKSLEAVREMANNSDADGDFLTVAASLSTASLTPSLGSSRPHDSNPVPLRT